MGGLLLRYSYCMPCCPNKGETWAHNARYLMKLQPAHQQPGRSPDICLSPSSRATGQFSGRQVPVTLPCASAAPAKEMDSPRMPTRTRPQLLLGCFMKHIAVFFSWALLCYPPVQHQRQATTTTLPHHTRTHTTHTGKMEQET